MSNSPCTPTPPPGGAILRLVAPFGARVSEGKRNLKVDTTLVLQQISLAICCVVSSMTGLYFLSMCCAITCHVSECPEMVHSWPVFPGLNAPGFTRGSNIWPLWGHLTPSMNFQMRFIMVIIYLYASNQNSFHG
jgi:hypothetical protein